jgi:hypothetical protein
VIPEARRVGQTRSEKLDLDVSTIHSQPELIDIIGRHTDSNVVLDVRLTGLYPDELDLDLDEIERALAPSFLRVRVRDMSIPAAPEGMLAPPDTVIGAFIRTVEERISELELSSLPDGDDNEGAPGMNGDSGTPSPLASPELDPAVELAELREVMRLGRHLLEGRQVTL